LFCLLKKFVVLKNPEFFHLNRYAAIHTLKAEIKLG